MLLFILLFQFICGVHGTESEMVCTANACFTFHLQTRSFEKAQMSCHYNGGNLATIKDINEAAKVRSVLARPNVNDFNFWIGLKLEKGTCTTAVGLRGFKWISGAENTQYANWEWEPKRTCTEDRCVSIRHTSFPSETVDLGWTDRTCKDEVHGFVCKFDFKGMCKALILAGPGEVSYIPPIVRHPVNNADALTLLPHATQATVDCNGKIEKTLCVEMRGFFGWTVSGLFCDSSKRGCTLKNGGCDHLCIDSGSSGIRCECKEGYELGEDKVTCILKDYCYKSPCKYKCVSGPEAYTCECPKGFQLSPDRINCIDINECLSPVCHHQCLNSNGGYTCSCNNGYTMVNGECRDIDECDERRCPQHLRQRCLNSPGSFSCHCVAGFRMSEDGARCIDIDECLGSTPCEDTCTNTEGSYTCSCRDYFKLAANGITCIPASTKSPEVDIIIPSIERSDRGDFGTAQPMTDSVSKLLNDWPKTPFNVVPKETKSVEYEDTGSYSNSSGTIIDTDNSIRQINVSSSSWMLVGIASSVSVLFLITVASVILTCRRNRIMKDKKKCSTADSYCWVSSGNETQTGKIEEQA